MNIGSSSHRSLRTALSVLALVVISVVMELAVFNLRHWETRSLVPQAIEPASTVSEVLPDGSVQTMVTMDLGNAKVGSVAMRIRGAQGLKVLRVAISDSGQSASAYDIAGVSVKGDDCEVIQPVHAYGYVKTVTLAATAPAGTSVELSEIRINEPVPLSVSKVRLALTFLFLLVLFVLRPGSVVWRVRHREMPLIAVASLIAVLFVALVGFGYGLEESGPESEWENPNRAWDEYAALARSIVDDGTVSLSQEVPEQIVQMDDLDSGDARLTGSQNVFDTSARQKATESLNENEWVNYKLDAAYYNGSYYVYFGVVPCLLVYVPFHILTGGDLSNTAACLPAIVMFLVFLFLCVEHVARRRFQNASCGAVVISYVGIVLCSAMPLALAAPCFYNVPVLYALAFLMIGAYLVLRAMSTSDRARRDVLAGFGVLALVLTAGCRPQVTLCAFLVGLWYVRWLITKRHFVARGIGAIAVPIVLVVAGLLWYNLIRFGSPLDFGANYNLTSNDMTLRGHSIERAVEGTAWYLSALPHLSGRFPFIESYIPSFAFGGKTISEPFTMGLLAACPFLLALPSLFAAARNLGRKRVLRVMFALVALCVLVVAFDTEGAGILMRYRLDFGYIAGMAFAGGLLCLDDGRMCSGNRLAQRVPVIYYTILALIVIAVLSGGLIWLTEMATHLQKATHPMWLMGYDQLRQTLEAWGAFVA